MDEMIKQLSEFVTNQDKRIHDLDTTLRILKVHKHTIEQDVIVLELEKCKKLLKDQLFYTTNSIMDGFRN